MGWLKDLFTGNEEQQKAHEKALEERKKDRTQNASLGTVLSVMGKGVIKNAFDNSLGGIIINALGGSRTPSIDVDKDGNQTIKPPNETIGQTVSNEVVQNINNKKEEIESALNNTPSDNKINEYKDDTSKMILDFLQKQEETRKQELEDAYKREDEIRKETQAREDSAYQRAVEDMRKAGINPNLVGISPSASGGGIISASRTEQVLGSEIQSYTTILNALIEKDTTMSEGDKNRLTQLISSASNIFLFSKLKGK